MTADADADLLAQVTRFIVVEARLQDDHEYEQWETLWAKDGVYWIPANGDGGDPEREMSIIYDNRSRIALRVKQLMTGRRLAQSPKSSLRRLVSNIEILGEEDGVVQAASNALIFEANARGELIWSTRNVYTLRREDGAWRMVRKKVLLTNNDHALYSMSFLV